MVLVWFPASAGTVDVLLRDENGAPVANQGVTVHPPQTEVGFSGLLQRDYRRMVRTGADGIASFDGLPPGPYTASVPLLQGVGLVPPEENPLAPVPTVTLAGEQERVRLEIELWHGNPVVTRVAVLRGELENARVRAAEIDQRFTLERFFRVNSDHERVLVAGRWELTLMPPPGYLLVGLDVDGRGVEGHVAELETESYGSPRFVTWHVTAPAAIAGNVSFDGSPISVQVIARLVQPGPWFESANRRGGSDFQLVQAVPDIKGDYLLELPDGRWEVSVQGDAVAEVDPPLAELDVPAGSEMRQDFRVSTEDEEKTGTLLVEVFDPDGGAVAGATVEVWPEDPALRGDEPVATEKSLPFRPTLIRGIPEGSYVVAAGHLRFVEGQTLLPDFDPEKEGVSRCDVHLRPAASVHALATDREGQPVPGVRLRMIRIDAGPATLISDPAIVAAVSEAHGESDATGHAWIEGVRPGAYELYAVSEGRGGPGRFVRFVDGDRLFESVELSLAAEEQREIEIKLLPAASFALHLRCSQGVPLPGAASAMVLPAPADDDAMGEGRWAERAVLRLDDRPLEGATRATLIVGPLEIDAYHVAVRLMGHQRWTWAMGTERLDEAAMLQAVTGEPTDLGTLEIDCGPAIRLEPRVASGQALPDLTLIERRAGGVGVVGTVSWEGRDMALRQPKIDSHHDAVVLRGLPEGEADLEVALSHPYFVPAVIRVQIREELERGGTTRVVPVIPAVGGVIRFDLEQAVAARIVDGAGSERVERSRAGGPVFENLAPGRYRVDLCGDVDCATIERSWDEVDVAPLKTIVLR